MATGDLQKDRQAVVDWARRLLEGGDNLAIIDTETNSLNGEVVEIGVVGIDGETLFHTLVKPKRPVEASAYAVHGISDADLEGKPTMAEVIIPMISAIWERKVVIYNADYDIKTMERSLRECGVHMRLSFKTSNYDFPNKHTITTTVFVNGSPLRCAMERYAQFYGQWDEKRGNYRWQKLPGAGHRALDDARATLRLIKQMAEG